MTKPVDSTGSAAAIAAMVRRAVTQKDKPASKAGQTNKSAHQAKQASRPALLSTIAIKAKALDPHAPGYQHRVLRLVVESALLHELGAHLVNAPRFQTMVDDILHDLESSPDLKDDVAQVVQQISSSLP